MNTLFGLELSTPVSFVLAFVIVLALIGGTTWLVRRFGATQLNSSAARGRQPRLAVIDAAAVDGRRRLVLIRRDNVEHLLMIGGPSDIVVEPNIVRATGSGRDTLKEPAAARPLAETLPRAAPLAEGTMWPLQPQVEPAARQRAPGGEEAVPWPLPTPAEPAPRQQRSADTLAGLAEELSMRSPPQRPAPPPAPPVPAAGANAASADQSLAEMAHRLEAALRRPAPPAEPNARPAAPEPAPRAAQEAAPPHSARANPPPEAARPGPAVAEPKAAKKNLYDSLEQEMASLLGRPAGKT